MTQSTVKISAYYKATYDYATGTYTHYPESPEWAQASIYVPSVEAARHLAAQFPKNLRLKAVTTMSPLDGDYRNGTVESGVVTMSARLAADSANGGRNETGIKRLNSFLRKAEAMGLPIEWLSSGLNAYASREDFDGAVGR